MRKKAALDPVTRYASDGVAGTILHARFFVVFTRAEADALLRLQPADQNVAAINGLAKIRTAIDHAADASREPTTAGPPLRAKDYRPREATQHFRQRTVNHRDLDTKVVDPSSARGQRIIRNAAYMRPVTQGDPPPEPVTERGFDDYVPARDEAGGIWK